MSIFLKRYTGTPDAGEVTPFHAGATRGTTLAEVIPLGRPRGSSGSTDSPAQDAAAALVTARSSMAELVDLLDRRCGDRWSELPSTLGRQAAATEALLVAGPTGIDPLVVGPTAAVDRALPLIRTSLALSAQVVDEAEVLGEALSADIVSLPLRHLLNVVGAVLDLGALSRVEPAWARPAAADAAHVVLATHGPELRATTLLHDDLYATYTDHVLDIPEASLRAGRHWWRLRAQASLRRELASSSRSGRMPSGLRSVVDQVLEVHEARRRLVSLAALLSTHLGRGGCGPLVDVGALAASLAAVQRVQRSLLERLDPDRLGALLAAEAFQSPELVAPAANLRTALGRWRVDVASLSGGDPWAMPATELAGWAVRTATGLPAISTGVKAMTEIGRPPDNLRALVDALLARERVDELAVWIGAHADAFGTGAGSAS